MIAFEGEMHLKGFKIETDNKFRDVSLAKRFLKGVTEMFDDDEPLEFAIGYMTYVFSKWEELTKFGNPLGFIKAQGPQARLIFSYGVFQSVYDFKMKGKNK